MKKVLFIALLSAFSLLAFVTANIDNKLIRATTIDSLGACQGISYQNGRIFLYGDREVGMIREFKLDHDSLVYLHKEYKLTKNGQDVISHPTGVAYNGVGPTFMGNSVKMNPEGTVWKTNIYCIDWKALLKTGTLDASLLNTIDDDACIQGTRPEYVKYHNKWYVATADYGDHGNEVRLYDPEKLKNCKKTSDPGVLFKKFVCTPWVQNLNWIADKGLLVLIQNKIEGRQWRFSYVDLEKSIDAGKQVVVSQVDHIDRADELEGFSFIGNHEKGIAVTSSRKDNVNYMDINW
jgi:phage gpG-like protein